MLVHPEPGGGIFPDNRLELVPASLRHFLERSVRGKFNPRMKNHAVSPAGSQASEHVSEVRLQAGQVLDRLMRRAIFSKTEAVMGEDIDHRQLR